MMRRFLFWITDYLRAREIRGDQGEPYLERYWLGRWFGARAYIHRFLASDPDRGLHDHPWGWSVSLILAGSYREIRPIHGDRYRPSGIRRLRAWQFNRILGDDFHRIVLDPGEEVWTLFVHGPRIKGWGFLRNGEYRLFAANKDDYPSKGWWKTAPRGRELRAAKQRSST